MSIVGVGVGGGGARSPSIATIAVPMAKNSMVRWPQPWECSSSWTPTIPFGVERLGLGLHALHRELARVVESLGVGRKLEGRDASGRAPDDSATDVIDAVAHHQADRPVAGA